MTTHQRKQLETAIKLYKSITADEALLRRVEKDLENCTDESFASGVKQYRDNIKKSIASRQVIFDAIIVPETFKLT